MATKTFTFTNGDIQLSASTGHPYTIEGRQKLGQDLAVMLGSEAQADNIGAGIDELTGLVGDEFSMRIELSSRIRRATQQFQTLQGRYNRGERGAEERLKELVYIQVSIFPEDATTFAYLAAFTSYDGRQTTLDGVV